DLNAPSGQIPVMAPPLRADDQILPSAFTAPPSIDGLIDFANQLGYPKLVRNLSNVVTNYLLQPWRALLTIINLCLTGKTSGFKRLRAHRRHRFHPRPDSPLHLPNEEPVLEYHKFSTKGTKREVFGMPIPGSLITTEIQQALYYQEYLVKVAQHRRYLAGKTGGVQDPPVSKPTQPARKPKTTAPKAPSRPSVSIPVRSVQPAPTSAPTKPQEKKRKQATETSNKPPKENKSKHGWMKMLSIKRGTLPPVVIREPESGKYQPLPEVPGKGKAKVTEEQVAHDLLSLQKHKKTSPANQYIFQRQVSEPTGSSEHDESLYTLLGQSDSEEESEKVMLGDEEGGQDEGWSKPDETSEGQAGPDPGDAEAKVQSIPSPVVHAGSDREHMDLDVADVSPQPSTEQLDEGFTATAYPKVQENLKLAVEEHVLLEEPASSSGTLSSLQHLSRDFSFGDQFFSDKPSDADKNTKTEVESMEHQQLKATTTNTTTTTTTTFLLPQALQQSTIEAIMMKRIGELEHIIADLIQVNKDMEERLDSHGSRLYTLQQLDIPQQVSIVRMWESESYKSHKDHMQLFEALENSATPSPSKKAASAEYQAWTTTDIRLKPSISLTPADLEMDEDMAPDEQAQSSNDEDIESAQILIVNLRQGGWKPFEEERTATPEPAWSIRSSDTGDISIFIDWFCKRRGITELKPQDLEGPAYEIIKVFHPNVIHLQYQMEECHKLLTDSMDDPILRHNVRKPLPLGGPPSQVTIQSDFFFNKDLEYLRYGSKGRRPALSISKMKAAYYPDAGLEQMSGHTCGSSVLYASKYYMKKIVLRRADLNEYVFTEQDFKYMYPSDFEDLYLLNLQGHLNHLLPKDKKILTTVVNLWTRQLVIRQRIEYFQLGIESYQTQLNLTKPHWDATGYGYKHDYTVIDSPRAAIFRDKYGVQMMMRVNEIHKKDVDQSKAFMFAIQRHLKTRRIFRSLEIFVGGCVRE
nr:E-beta-farnesene synthase [Tanacetum cinerariifolium]